MTPLTKKRGSWLTTVPLAAIALAFVAFVYVPTSKEIKRLRGAIDAQRNYVLGAQPLVATILQAQQELAKTATVHAVWQASAPDDRTLPQVHEQINACARKARAKITRFDPQPDVRFRTFRELHLRLGAAGSFAELFATLANLEELPQTVWLDELHIDAPRRNEQHAQCQVKLVIFAKNSEISD